IKNINKKTIKSIIAIYLIHLFFYIGMSYIILTNMSTWNRVVQKLNINSNIDQYNHLYISVFYFILSTYLMLESLDFSIHKLIKILVYTISFAFLFIALYKYCNYSPPQASEILKIIWTNISAYVIVELSSNRSEGIYYGLSRSHSGRYYETVRNLL